MLAFSMYMTALVLANTDAVRDKENTHVKHHPHWSYRVSIHYRSSRIKIDVKIRYVTEDLVPMFKLVRSEIWICFEANSPCNIRTKIRLHHYCEGTDEKYNIKLKDSLISQLRAQHGDSINQIHRKYICCVSFHMDFFPPKLFLIL